MARKDKKSRIWKSSGHHKVVSMMQVLMLLVILSLFAAQTEASSYRKPIPLKDAVTAANTFSKSMEECFEKIVVAENSSLVQVDGRTASFADVFSASDAVSRKAVSSRKKLEAFLEKEEDRSGQIYEVTEDSEGVYSVQAPYQTRRIVICSTDVKKNYGASSWYVYAKGGKTILCFDTEEETKAAYEKIKADYGVDHAYVDSVISLQTRTQEFEGSEELILEEETQEFEGSEEIILNEETQEEKILESNTQVEEETKVGATMLSEQEEFCYSWGAHTMGMDHLKYVNDFPADRKVTVAVIDTGVTTTSPVFKGTKISSKSYNFANGNSNVKDTIGHGTHVTGIIADLTPDNVEFLIVKVADADGTSSSLVMGLGMDYAIEQNADVINLSYGFLEEGAYRYYFMDDSINQAYKKGIPVCAAAGNSNNAVKGRAVKNCYPACNRQTVSVSALSKDNVLADYSYYGNAIDFAAPGDHIISAGTKGNLVSMSGTSMAAPHISAAMAYLKLAKKSMSVQGLCMELRKYSVDLGSKGKDDKYGYGCPDLSTFLDYGITYKNWTCGKMLSAPKSVTCTNGAKGNVLTWKNVSKAQGYYIYRRKDGGANRKIATVSAPNTTYTHS